MSFKSLKLSVKIPLVMLVLAAANALIVSSLAVYQAKETAKTLSQQKLEAVTHGVSNTLESYFESIKEDLLLLSFCEFWMNQNHQHLFF